MPGIAVAALRRRGIDVLTAHEAGTCGNSDEEQLRFATANGRVMATFDTDYLILAASFLATGETFAGITYCRPDKYSQNPSRLAAELAMLHAVYTADEMLNHVEYL
jgi:hypothetical protein